jgi:hypothetical protein
MVVDRRFPARCTRRRSDVPRPGHDPYTEPVLEKIMPSNTSKLVSRTAMTKGSGRGTVSAAKSAAVQRSTKAPDPVTKPARTSRPSAGADASPAAGLATPHPVGSRTGGPLAGASTRQSGKVKSVSFRWGANKQLRDAPCDFAGDSRHASPGPPTSTPRPSPAAVTTPSRRPHPGPRLKRHSPDGSSGGTAVRIRPTWRLTAPARTGGGRPLPRMLVEMVGICQCFPTRARGRAARRGRGCPVVK